MATPTQMKGRGRLSLILGSIFAALALGAVMASGAELVTAEVNGTANDVTVTQGTTENFNIKLSATGNISAAITSANPSQAKVLTTFSISAGGAVTGATFSGEKKFYAAAIGCSGGGNVNCDVTWDGAPTAYDVPASVTANAATPVGIYTITLSESAGTTSETNPSVSGGKLTDTSATAIKVHVVAPAITDTDGDGVADSTDNCPTVANPGQENNDGDTQGDACDADDDNDGVADGADNCSLTANPGQADNDGDGQGDVCDTDDDNDGVADGGDNCPLTSNSGQTDSDGDGQGDVCDADDDNDTVADGADNCPLAANPGQADNDGDGQGDVCDADDDNDGVADGADNCPLASNPGQADNDGDGQGDVCDADDDNDGVADGADNCPLASNSDQADGDGDGLGNACDPNAFAPAVGSAAGDASGQEGDTLASAGSFTDGDGNGTLTITKVSGAGAVTDNGDGTWSWSYATTDNGSGAVVVQADDGEHAAETDSFDWSATNVDPTATINGAPASSPEGTLISLTSSVSDPGSADTHTYAWSVEKDGSSYASGTGATFSFTPDDNGSYEVKLTVTDDDGGSGSDTETIGVTNVAPTIGTPNLSGNTGTACLSGNTVNLQFSFSDPAGSNDTYTGSINWGDTNTTSFGSSFSVNASHTYSPGTYTIKVNVHDEDGGVAAEKQGNVSHLYSTGSGILQPINMTGSRSAFKTGSTVPVKIRITDCNGNPAGTLSPQVSLIKLDGSPEGVAVEDFYSTVPDQGTTMRFTGSPDYQYIYNLGTKGQTQGDFKVTITDPTIAPVSATFSLKK